MQGKKTKHRSWLRTWLSFLPKALRFPVIRKLVVVSYDEMPRLEMRIARTADELEQAYRILHDCYVDQKYMTPNPSGMRIIKYFALPSTTTLIALWDGKIVGTMSIIRKTSFGLPIENAFNIDALSENQAAIAEVSSLAIAKEFRASRGLLFFPFCKFFYEYSEKYLRLYRIVIAVHPSMSDFYEGVLGFEVIQKNLVSQYKFANGNPAVGLWADFGMLRRKVEKWYAHKDPLHNLDQYFTKHKCHFIKYPDRPYIKATDAVLTTDDFVKFFITNSNIYMELTTFEQMALESIYPDLAPSQSKNLASNRRQSTRFITENEARTDDHLQQKIRILDVSKQGLRMQVEAQFFDFYKAFADTSQLVHLRVKISDDKYSKVSGVIHWFDQSNLLIGLRILRSDEIWEEYISYLNSDLKLKSS